MLDAVPLTVLDAALRGMLVSLLVVLAVVLLRDRPRLPAAQAAVAMCLGLCVQVISSTPLLEARLSALAQRAAGGGVGGQRGAVLGLRAGAVRR